MHLRLYVSIFSAMTSQDHQIKRAATDENIYCWALHRLYSARELIRI